MRAKWIYIYLFLILFGFNACDEEVPSPSYVDEDRVEGLLDLSKPLVKEYKEKYGVNILYNFDDTLDFKFGFYTLASNQKWSAIGIRHLDSEETVDYAFQKLDEMVFRYFNDDFKKYLPYKLLVSDMVILAGDVIPDALISEPDGAESGTVTAIGNTYSYMFAFNKEAMESFSASKLKNLRDVKLYHLISYIMDKHHLYEEIPASFYTSVAGLHGQSIDSLAKQEEVLPVGSGSSSTYYKPEWYMGLGMALTMNSPRMGAASNFSRRLQMNNSLYIPAKERDFRNFLCVMLFTKKSDLERYYLSAPLFCERMKIAIETLQGWGVKMLEVNPDLEMFLN